MVDSALRSGALTINDSRDTGLSVPERGDGDLLGSIFQIIPVINDLDREHRLIGLQTMHDSILGDSLVLMINLVNDLRFSIPQLSTGLDQVFEDLSEDIEFEIDMVGFIQADSSPVLSLLGILNDEVVIVVFSQDLSLGERRIKSQFYAWIISIETKQVNEQIKLPETQDLASLSRLLRDEIISRIEDNAQ